MAIRLSFVITRLIRGGAQRIVLTLLERLDRSRFDIELVTGAQTGSEGSFLADAERLGLPVRVVPALAREIHPLRDASAIGALWRHFRRVSPHIVHAHTYKACVLGAFAARAAGVPRVILSPHGHIFEPEAGIPGVPRAGARLYALRELTRAAQRCADRVLALSEEDLRGQLRYGLAPRSRYRVIQNGIACPAEADVRPRPRVAGRGPVIGSVGRLTREKGHALLLEGIARLRPRCPTLRVRIVGGGPEEAALREQARRAGLDDCVEWAGHRSDVMRQLAEMDVYVHPALYEGQGLAILEAMACGRPVIATAVGGVPAVVRDGETGVLVPPRDPAALAEAVERLWNDPARAERLARNARAFVEKAFPVEAMVKAYERLYRDLAKGEGAG